eukprot:14495983-Alexandrium_andersonii.AAC.1
MRSVEQRRGTGERRRAVGRGRVPRQRADERMAPSASLPPSGWALLYWRARASSWSRLMP